MKILKIIISIPYFIVLILWAMIKFPFVEIDDYMSSIRLTRKTVKEQFIIKPLEKIPSIKRIKIKGFFIPYINEDLKVYIYMNESEYVMDLLIGHSNVKDIELKAQNHKHAYVKKIKFIIINMVH